MMELVKKLHLKRPLVFFDLETTGTKVGVDRIVEMAMVKLMPDGTVVRKPEQTGKTHRILVNPEMPIPKEVSEIHGITDDKVENAPTFKEISKTIYNFVNGCDLAGYNSDRFDIPLLVEELLRAEIAFDFKDIKTVDVQTIFCLLYTSPSPRDATLSRMPSSA